MKEIISIVLSNAIICSLFVLPVSAQTNIYSAYLEVLNDAVKEYGEYEQQDYLGSTGVGYVKLVDFDNDGTNELLYCTGRYNDDKKYDENQYQYHIYTYKNGTAELLTEGSMEAHGGDENWEITLWTSGDNVTRLSKSRWTDIACESEYITFYEYDGGSWEKDEDAFTSVAVETEPGIYYFDYYIHGEKVSKDEYDSRLHMLSKNNKISIEWTDFSGSYLEEVGAGLSDMNYWYGDKELNASDTSEKDSIVYSDKILQFRRLQMHNGIMYVTPMAATNGGIVFGDGNVTTKILPCYDGINDIYAFSIYNNKIYYISGPAASDSTHTKLYECDINGDNVIELADNLNNYSHAFVYNGNIYYDTMSSLDDNLYITTEYPMDGIYGVNITSHDVNKIVNKSNARLGMVDNKNIFYSHNERNYYCNLDGTDDIQAAEHDDRCGSITIEGYVGIPGSNEAYCTSNGIIYRFELNSYDDGTYIADVGRNAVLIGIDGNNIYYKKTMQQGTGGIAYIYSYALRDNSNTAITVTINDNPIDFDQTPIIIDDRTLVPLRAIFEALGATVEWDGDTQTVTSEYNGIKIKLTIGDDKIYINGKENEIDASAQLIDGTTYVPIRAVAEAFNADVSWDGESKTVIIKTNDAVINNTTAPSGIPDATPTIKATTKPSVKPTASTQSKATSKPKITIKPRPSNKPRPTKAPTPEPTAPPEYEKIVAEKDGTGHCSYVSMFAYDDSGIYTICPECGDAEYEFLGFQAICSGVTVGVGKQYTYHNCVKCKACGKEYYNYCFAVSKKLSDDRLYTIGYPYMYNTAKKNHSGNCSLVSMFKLNDDKISVVCPACSSEKKKFLGYQKICSGVIVFYGSEIVYHNCVECKDCGLQYWNYCFMSKKSIEDRYLYEINPAYTVKDIDIEKDEKPQATQEVVELIEDTIDDDAFYTNEVIVKANILRQNSMYKYLKTTTGVHKIYGANFDKTVPKFYDSLNKYKSQMLKKTAGLSNYRDFYELALLDILTLNTNDEDQADDDVAAIVKKIVDEEADAIKNGKSINDLKESVQKIMGVTLDNTDIDFLEYILNMKDITDEVYDTLEYMIKLRIDADGKKEILENIKKITDNSELKSACEALIKDVKKAKEAKKADYVAIAGTTAGKDISEDVVIGLLDDKLIPWVGKRIPVVAAASIAKEGSLLIGNMIFKADDIASDLLIMSALCDIDSAVKEVMLKSENAYIEKPNYDNALDFTSAADCYKALQIYGCDAGIKFAKDVKANERNSVISSVASPVIGLISLPTFIKRISGNAADYETIIEDITSIKDAWFYINLYNTNNFDVSEYISMSKSGVMSDWAKPYVDKAKQYGILPDYLYCNYQHNITRAEFCTLLTNLLEQTTGESIDAIIEQYGLQIKSEYSDVSYYYVTCMTQLGIVSGIGKNKFNPLGEITRQEAAVMLKRTADIIGAETNKDISVSEGDSWAKEGIAFAIKNNIMSGTGDNFDAYGKFTKEQALTTLVRFYENFVA